MIDPGALAPVLQTIAVAMAVILVSLVLLLVLQKLWLERRSRAVEETADRYAKALAGGARPQDLPVDPRRLIERRALARVLAAGRTDIETAQLCSAPWYGALMGRLQRDAVHREWGGRVAAFEMLGDLGAAELGPFLEAAARREKHPQAYAACLGCLARFVDRPSGLAGLWARLQENPPLSGSFNEGLFRTAIAALIRRGCVDTAADAVRELLAAANAHDPLTLHLVSAIGKSGLVPLTPRLVALHGQPAARKSLRIACMRAVGMLQPDHPLLLGALNDRDWEVRAIGAKYLRASTPAVIAGLSDCLGSSAFYVRYNAASTLAALGERGRAALERALTSSDPFTRDISQYALRVLQLSHA